MTSIQRNIHRITAQITQLEQKFARAQGDVQLLAVSKTKPKEAILEAYQANLRCFGENYVQEGVSKVAWFNDNHPDMQIDWHFIGPIQSNKTRQVAEYFDWVHTIDRVKTAQRLNDQRPENMSPLQVLIQVNTSDEESKSGVKPNEVFALAQLISSLPNLTLRGVMSIPASVTDYQSQLQAFQKLQQIQLQLAESYSSVDTLSMGMSADMEAAIEAGSTIVRIGTAIFGARDYADKQEQTE